MSFLFIEIILLSLMNVYINNTWKIMRIFIISKFKILPLMLDIDLWILSMSSRMGGSSNEETFQQEFDTNDLVSWIFIRASCIFFSFFFKDPSRKLGSCKLTSLYSSFLLGPTSWSSSGDGEVDVVSYSTAIRYSFSCLLEIWLEATFWNMIFISPT